MAEVEDTPFETFEDLPAEDTTEAAVVPAEVDEDVVLLQPSELPDIKLFGRWSCDDVHVSDMSLAVSFKHFFFLNCSQESNIFFFFCLGLYCS